MKTPYFLSRLSALWLVALILLPFSAPFSTCDLDTFFTSADHQLSPGAARSYTPAGSLAKTATHAIPVSRHVRRADSATSSSGASGRLMVYVTIDRSPSGAATFAVSRGSLVLPLRV